MLVAPHQIGQAGQVDGGNQVGGVELGQHVVEGAHVLARQGPLDPPHLGPTEGIEQGAAQHLGPRQHLDPRRGPRPDTDLVIEAHGPQQRWMQPPRHRRGRCSQLLQPSPAARVGHEPGHLVFVLVGDQLVEVGAHRGQQGGAGRVHRSFRGRYPLQHREPLLGRLGVLPGGQLLGETGQVLGQRRGGGQTIDDGLQASRQHRARLAKTVPGLRRLGQGGEVVRCLGASGTTPAGRGDRFGPSDLGSTPPEGGHVGGHGHPVEADGGFHVGGVNRQATSLHGHAQHEQVCAGGGTEQLLRHALGVGPVLVAGPGEGGDALDQRLHAGQVHIEVGDHLAGGGGRGRADHRGTGGVRDQQTLVRAGHQLIQGQQQIGLALA